MIRILGIDPGSLLTGYGIIEMDGNYAKHVTHGLIRLGEKDISKKLQLLFRELITVIHEFRPNEVSIEKVFLHKNVDSALKLGQARGCAITACAEKGLPIYEYAATQVKKATVGKGHATKQQIQHMVKVLLCLDSNPQADSADALAIALCHGHSREGLLRMNEAKIARKGTLQ